MLTIDQIFWQSAYPIYSIAKMAGCCDKTILNLFDKYMVVTFHRNGTCFISRTELIKVFSLPFDDCRKYLENIISK